MVHIVQVLVKHVLGPSLDDGVRPTLFPEGTWSQSGCCGAVTACAEVAAEVSDILTEAWGAREGCGLFPSVVQGVILGGM